MSDAAQRKAEAEATEAEHKAALKKVELDRAKAELEKYQRENSAEVFQKAQADAAVAKAEKKQADEAASSKTKQDERRKQAREDLEDLKSIGAALPTIPAPQTTTLPEDNYFSVQLAYSVLSPAVEALYERLIDELNILSPAVLPSTVYWFDPAIVAVLNERRNLKLRIEEATRYFQILAAPPSSDNSSRAPSLKDRIEIQLVDGELKISPDPFSSKKEHKIYMHERDAAYIPMIAGTGLSTILGAGDVQAGLALTSVGLGLAQQLANFVSGTLPRYAVSALQTTSFEASLVRELVSGKMRRNRVAVVDLMRPNVQNLLSTSQFLPQDIKDDIGKLDKAYGAMSDNAKKDATLLKQYEEALSGIYDDLTRYSLEDMALIRRYEEMKGKYFLDVQLLKILSCTVSGTEGMLKHENISAYTSVVFFYRILDLEWNTVASDIVVYKDTKDLRYDELTKTERSP